jgi:hypothetical protein
MAIMSESLDEGQLNPSVFSFARYASSVESADAIAVLAVRAAPTITGIASLASHRGADISSPFSIGVQGVVSIWPLTLIDH